MRRRKNRVERTFERVSQTLRTDRPLRSLWNYFLNYWSLKTEPLRVPSRPLYVQIEPTTHCNLHCKMCYGTFPRRPIDDMSFEKFKQIVDQFHTFTKIHLQGIGESFMHREIFPMIRYAKSKGHWVDLATNATIFNDRMVQNILQSGLDEISVSIDGATDESYTSIRWGGTLEKVRQGVRKLMAARGDSDRPNLLVNVVVMKENVHELVTFMEFTASLGIPHIRFTQCQAYNERQEKKGGADGGNGYFDLIDRNFPAALKRARELGVEVNGQGMQIRDSIRRCKFPWISMSVTIDGYVVPCCRVLNPETVNFGNLHEESLEAIWNRPEYVQFREALKSNKPHKACVGCELYNVEV